MLLYEGSFGAFYEKHTELHSFRWVKIHAWPDPVVTFLDGEMYDNVTGRATLGDRHYAWVELVILSDTNLHHPINSFCGNLFFIRLTRLHTYWTLSRTYPFVLSIRSNEIFLSLLLSIVDWYVITVPVIAHRPCCCSYIMNMSSNFRLTGGPPWSLREDCKDEKLRLIKLWGVAVCFRRLVVLRQDLQRGRL